MAYRHRMLGVALALSLLPWTGNAAGEESLRAVMSWSGHGQFLQINLNEQDFLGMIEGILYIETSEGVLDEAFMECTVKLRIHTRDKETNAEGNCLIIQSGEDNVFAEYQCNGPPGACNGSFNLTGGTGRFEGIQGKSELIIRSPMRHLTNALTDVENLVVDNGVMLLPDLKYRLKGEDR